jgi:hypothetical protein
MPPMGPADPASAPTQDMGSQAAALSQVREGVKILEMALPALELGSDPHKAVLSAISSLSKVVPPSSEVPGVQMTTLTGLQKKAQESQMLQQLASAMGQGPNVPAVM